MQEYDIIIVGGGMVGSCLALGLAGLRNVEGQVPRIALLEARTPDWGRHPGFDARAIALAQGSQEALASLGLWSRLAAEATPITNIHVSDRGHFGRVELSAAEYRLPALGYVVELETAGRQLHQALQACAHIDYLCPATPRQVVPGLEQVTVQLEDGRELSARLLVAADGADSRVRQQLKLPQQQFDYGQCALIATLQTDRPHGGRAWERFTDSGPLALLPLQGDRYSLVWTVRPSEVDELLALDDTAFLQRLQQRFGYRAGLFQRVGARSHYPLSLKQVERPLAQRSLLLGNAAHQLHPVAGQGFNLGLRDLMALRAQLAQAWLQGDDPGDYRLLRAYWQQRCSDQARSVWFTSCLASLFASEAWPLVLGRNLGLALMNRCSLLKRQLAQQAMGKMAE